MQDRHDQPVTSAPTIDPARYRWIETIFQRAADLPAEQREAFLETACGNDPALREQVERLLAHADRPETFTPLRDEMSRDDSPADGDGDDLVGRHVGHYAVLERVGEGGFGDVYRAWQFEPLQRTVALKVIKRGMDTRHVIARFEAERDALALMDHPHIARVFDAGVTDDGRPYFVMEFVEGQPMTTFCDERNLSVRDRIRLFAHVCHAVQHAHQKGIIHRDLKPTNIIVSVIDGVSVAKVIDFGIAKAVRGQSTGETIETVQRGPIGTPAYMAPEQATPGSGDLDTRVDIYALGVLLYELLVGARPFDAQRLDAMPFDEVLHVIREEEPPRPSTRVGTLGPERRRIARNRRVDPRTLRRVLRGDLDWITVKCMEKDRSRRYATASELAADLQRHLAHEPVLATPPSTLYRARKFLRRHRFGVLAAAVIALALIGGTLSTTWQARRAAQRQREATRQATIAQAVNDFLNHDVLAAADPRESSDRELTVREALDIAAQNLGDRFADQPLVKAAIHTTLGETYLHLGEYRDSAHHLQRAYELRRNLLGAEHPDTLETMNDLARVYRRLQRFDEAEQLFRETIETARRVVGPENKLTLQPMNNLAVLYNRQERYEEAEPLYREVLEIRRRMLGADHPRTLVCMSNLAQHYASRFMLERAERLMREAYRLQCRRLGEDHYETLVTLNNLAMLHVDQGEYDQAIELLRDVIDRRTRTLGAEHPYTLLSRVNLGSVHVTLADYDEAERVLWPAYQAQLRTLGEENRWALIAMNDVARLRLGQGRSEAAQRLASRAFTTTTRVLGADDAITWRCACTLAEALAARGDLAEAEKLYRDAHDALARLLGRGHPSTLTCAAGRANVALRQDRDERAVQILQDALVAARNTLPDGHPRLGLLLASLGRCKLAMNRPGDALAALTSAESILEETLGPNHPRAEACRQAIDDANARR